jgi:hypothetical protein
MVSVNAGSGNQPAQSEILQNAVHMHSKKAERLRDVGMDRWRVERVTRGETHAPNLSQSIRLKAPETSVWSHHLGGSYRREPDGNLLLAWMRS